MTIQPEALIAYVDGEADADTIAAIEAEAAADPQLAAEIARHRAARDRLSAAFAGTMTEPIPDRLLQAVLAGKDETVVDFARARAARVPRYLTWAAGMAASLVVGVAIGGQLIGGGPIGDDFTVKGQLAQALDQRLASEPAAANAIRIGVSFRTAEGGYCRTFQTPGAEGLAGVACHEDDRWRAVAVAPQPSTASEYRMAAAAPPIILRTAEALMAGQPLVADAEARARDKGWR
jgi:hypothetical protein